MAAQFREKLNLPSYALLFLLIGTFRFYDEDESEYEIWLPVFRENS